MEKRIACYSLLVPVVVLSFFFAFKQFDQPLPRLEPSLPAPPKLPIELLNRLQAIAPALVDFRRVKRVLIITCTRSGSSFLGDLLQQSSPQTFYFFEPLHSLAPNSLITKPRRDESTELINHLFHCRFEALPAYINYTRYNTHFAFRNRFLLKLCGLAGNVTACLAAHFSQEACRRSEVQIMKLVRLPLRDIVELELPPDTKLVYLQRDPRAIYSSRKKLGWCTKKTCLNLNELCGQRADDLTTLEGVERDAVVVVRFEDLAANPLAESRRLFKQLGLSYTHNVEQFIEAHTNSTAYVKDHFSTYRQSSAVISRWRTDLTATEIAEIQRVCASVLKRAGYAPV